MASFSALLLAASLGVSPSGASPAPVPAALEPFEARWELLLVADGRPQPVGTVTAKLDATELAGEPAFSYTQFSDDPLGSVWRQVIVRRVDLAPVRHETKTGAGGAMRLEYAGDRVRGTRTETALGGEERPVDAKLDPGTFDTAVLGLVIRSLPLDEGYRTRISVYGPGETGDAGASAEVTVVGRELVRDAAGRPAEAWIVDVSLDEVPSSRFWIIDTAPYVARKLMRTGGVEFRLVEPEKPS